MGIHHLLSSAAILSFVAFGAAACGSVSDPISEAGPDAGPTTDGGVGIDPDAMVEDDLGPPETTIDSAPVSPSNSRAGSISFSSSKSGSTFMCKLGVGSFELCTSPVDVGSDSDGAKLFEVYAIDAQDKLDPTPASHGWIVDTKLPVVTVSSGPNNPTNSSSATLIFRADEEASFVCSVDDGPFSECSSPKNYTTLDPGPHHFDVQATDLADNIGVDEYLWVVDANAPSLEITSTPADPTQSTTADFEFKAEAGTEVQCRLDDKPYRDCTTFSTNLYLELQPNRSYTFEVMAKDSAGNFATASYGWEIDTRKPVVDILNRPSDPSDTGSAAFTFSSDEVATMDCSIEKDVFLPCDEVTSHSFPSLLDGRQTFVVSATDLAGNVGTATYSWTIDTTPPPTVLESRLADPYPVDYATFRFSSRDPSATFQCSIDDSDFQKCTSPKTYRGIGYRDHIFLVRAVDPLNNIDASPAEQRWTARPGLILHYPMEGNLRNASALGSRHDGDGGGLDFAEGPVGRQALVFDGSAKAGAKLYDTIEPMSNDKAYSLGLFVFEPGRALSARLLDFMGKGGGISLSFPSVEQDLMQVLFNTEAAVVEAGKLTVPVRKGWQHIALVYSEAGAQLDVYLNAVLVTSIKNTKRGHIYSEGQSESILLGFESSFAIDEIRVYNHKMGPKEVCELLMGRLWVDGRAPYCK